MGRTFAAQMEGFDRRVKALLSACSAQRVDRDRIMAKVIEELSTSLEELKVAEEELAAQNVELETAHARLEAERRRYREFFMSAPEAYLLTDDRGTIGEANHAAATLLGMSVDLLSGKPLPLFVASEDRPDFQHWLVQIRLRELGAASRHEARVGYRSRRSSRDHDVLCSFSVWRTDDEGGRGSLRWALDDLTLRERARERDRFEEQAARKDEFLAVLGHELRNPLAAIALAADVLRRAISVEDGRAAMAADTVRRHSAQVNRLVGDLLDVSRVYHGKVQLSCQPLDLFDVVTDAIETVQPLLRQKHHLLAIDRDEEPLVVDGDPVRLQQVMVNLLDNAARYTPEGGRIEVRLHRTGGRAVVAVRDFGAGIEPEVIDRIFGLFEQGGSGNGSPAGLGIGLTLARELVKMHGGNIVARSGGADQGAEFLIDLPLRADPRVGPEQVASVEEGAVRRADGAARVLIVDDNQDAADLVGMSLAELGHQVSIAYTADRAEELVGQCSVALVDLSMPEITGFELAPRLRARAPDVELCALTGFGDDRHRAAAEEAGFQHYILKPVDITELDALLRSLVAAPAEGGRHILG
jgi:PAS domain S-box-containing protein